MADDNYYELLKESGDNHKYQTIVLVLLSVGWGFINYFPLSLGLLELDNQNKLINSIIRQSNFNYTENFSFISKYSQLSSNLDISMIGISLNLGFIIGTLILIYNCDNFSRIKPLKFSIISYSLILILYPFLPVNLYFLYIFLIIIGTLISISNYFSYILIVELIDLDYFDYYSETIYNSSCLFGIIFIWLIFYLNDINRVSVFVGLGSLIVGFLYSILVFESPKYYFNNDKFDETREIIENISIINHKLKNLRRFKNSPKRIRLSSPSPVKLKLKNKAIDRKSFVLEDDYNHALITQRKENKVTFLYIISSKKMSTTFGVMSIFWFFISGMYYGSLIYVKFLDIDPYVLTSFLFFSELFTSTITNQIVESKFIGYRVSYGFLLILISFFVAFSLRITDSPNLECIFFIFIRFFVTILLNLNYRFTSEIYDEDIFSLAMKYNSIAGRLGVIINFLVLEYMKKKYYLFCMISCFILLLFSCLINEPEEFENNDKSLIDISTQR